MPTLVEGLARYFAWLEDCNEWISFSRLLASSAWVVNPETVTISSNKHCLCQLAFSFIFRHTYLQFSSYSSLWSGQKICMHYSRGKQNIPTGYCSQPWLLPSRMSLKKKKNEITKAWTNTTSYFGLWQGWIGRHQHWSSGPGKRIMNFTGQISHCCNTC